MNRIIAMGMAYDIIEQMAEERKISQGQYLESIDDIREALCITEAEYQDSIDGNWDPKPTKEILDIN